jgi:subtilase family serine protease
MAKAKHFVLSNHVHRLHHGLHTIQIKRLSEVTLALSKSSGPHNSLEMHIDITDAFNPLYHARIPSADDPEFA